LHTAGWNIQKYKLGTTANTLRVEHASWSSSQTAQGVLNHPTRNAYEDTTSVLNFTIHLAMYYW